MEFVKIGEIIIKKRQKSYCASETEDLRETYDIVVHKFL